MPAVFEYYNLLHDWVAWQFFWSEKAAQKKTFAGQSEQGWNMHHLHVETFVSRTVFCHRSKSSAFWWCQPWCGDWNKKHSRWFYLLWPFDALIRWRSLNLTLERVAKISTPKVGHEEKITWRAFRVGRGSFFTWASWKFRPTLVVFLGWFWGMKFPTQLYGEYKKPF